MSAPIPVACKDCKREGLTLRDCRIRIINYAVFNRRCPRELAGVPVVTEAAKEARRAEAPTTYIPTPPPLPAAGDQYVEIPLNRIFWKESIRKAVKEEDIKNMAMSFTCHGQIEPIVVAPPNEEGLYRGVVGRLRYEGMKSRMGATILARVHPFKDEREIIEWQLAENLHRVDLPAMDKAEAYRQLYEMQRDESGKIYGEQVVGALAKRIEGLTGGKQAERTIYKYIQMSYLPEGVKDFAVDGKIGVEHGQQLLRLKDRPDKQLEAAEKTVQEAWTVEKLKKFVDSTLEPQEPKAEPLLTGFKIECPECHIEILIDHREFPDGKVDHKLKELSAN